MKLRCTKVLIALMVGLVGVSAAVQGAVVDYGYDFIGYSVPESSMAATFGTKIAELNADSYGFDFSGGDPTHGLRNLNIISEVYVATQSVTIGTGVNGTPIQLQTGDYTFAYTLDYSVLLGFLNPNSTVSDLQLARSVVGGVVPNPGQMIAFGEIMAGGHNTDPGFGDGGAGTPAFQGYPDGFDGTLWDFAPAFLAGQVEYDWGTSVVLPGTKAMVLMFATSNVDVWQAGWGSENGQGVGTLAERQAIGNTGEGGSVIGGGNEVGNIPVLIPVVVPEPISFFSFLLVGNVLFLTKRRK